MSTRSQVMLWAAQRASAVVLAVCVVVHLITIIYAVRGLSAAEILGRTRGNVAWAAFYAVFVTAVSVHAPIGLRSILNETFGWRGGSLNFVVALLGLGLAVLGFRAVAAVFG